MIRTTLALAFVIAVAVPGVATAEKRVALVIANGAYENTRPLRNPVADGQAIAAELRALSFDVIDGYDLTTDAMAGALRDFKSRLISAQVALFFYAGHGLQVAGRNYLIPVDASLESEIDLQFEAVPIHVVLGQMEAEPRVNLVFLDACRDNPLARSLARSLGPTRSTAVQQGLAPERAGDGTLITYATDPGDVAYDGTGEHSPFTQALLQHMAAPSIVVEQMLNRVKRDVREATNDRQRPWVHSSLARDFYLNPAAATSPAPEPSVASAELLFWDSIKDSRFRADFEAYLIQFPEGTFAALARNRLSALSDAAPTAQEADPVVASLPPAVTSPPDSGQPVEDEAAMVEDAAAVVDDEVRSESPPLEVAPPLVVAVQPPSSGTEPTASSPTPDVASLPDAGRTGGGVVQRVVARAPTDVVAEPDPYGRRVARLERGDVVTVIDQPGDTSWYLVETERGTGYVYKLLVRSAD